MKINELTGYRNNPVYRGIKKVKPNSSEEFESDSLKGVVELMKQNGWDTLGWGSFAYVFGNNSKPYVIKIFVNDDAYAGFVKYTMKNQNNPFLPKIRGKLIRFSDHVRGVRLERLKPVVDSNQLKKYLPKEDGEVIPSEYMFDDEYLPYIEKKHPQLAQIYHDLTAMGYDGWDLREANLMLRGKQLVIIDPVADV